MSQGGVTQSADNAVEAAILSRRSVRAFLPTPVPRETVAHLLDIAARAPSSTNMQPWQVIALAGAALDRVRTGVAAAYTGGTETTGGEFQYYPQPFPEPWLARRRKIGWDMYGLLGIARGETGKAADHMVSNLHFFGAPVGLICTMDRRLQTGSWLDYGMFLQNIAVAARARGLDTCPMAVFAQFPNTLRALLGLGADSIIVCGMALGHEDRAAPVNTLVTERVPAAEFTRFLGW